MIVAIAVAAGMFFAIGAALACVLKHPEKIKAIPLSGIA